MPVLDINGLIDERALAIRDYHRQSNVPRAELDLSGGIDSAVMAGLLVLALGPGNVTLVHSNINSNPVQTRRAVALAKGLGCQLINIDLGGIYRDILGLSRQAIINASGDEALAEVLARCDADPTIEGSFRSTLRAPIGRWFNRLMGNGIRHGTGNKCEDEFLRYFQKGGDGEVDTNPIEMLSKSEVYQLAWGLARRFPLAKDAYLETIQAKPSADLWAKGDEQTDESELKNWLKVPFTYGTIDIETGAIKTYGTIERVSLALGLRMESFGTHTLGERLFGALPVTEEALSDLVGVARRYFPEDQFTTEEVGAFLLAARKAEKNTRHKSNENIPILGTRESLVRSGILSNELT